jgi:2-methylisocitrate lyase-like PEP mutase family enzyme
MAQPLQSTPSDVTVRRAAFCDLHKGGCFVIPNPWDRGSACYLARLGFHALATTSAGFGFSRGLPDSADTLTRDEVIAHVADIVSATTLPVNADFQSGYSATAAGVAESVRRCVGAGVAGLSIEDSTGDPARPLFELPAALERLAGAREGIGNSGVLLTARAECFLVGHPDPLRESIRRLEKYAEAGADVLFAPGVKAAKDIQALVAAVRPKPVNVLVSAPIGLEVAGLAALGVRRISVGSALARSAWTGFMRAARELSKGTFGGLEDAVPFATLNDIFREIGEIGQ